VYIKIFTDGSSSGNPGPGGWGAVVFASKNDGNHNVKSPAYAKALAGKQNSKNAGHVTELGGGEKKTTNNRMELKAVIESLRFVKSYELRAKSYELVVYSDSSYVINGATKWLDGWIDRDWINSKKEPVQNRDLWEALVRVEEGMDVSWKLLPGHSGISGNERADEIATSFTMGKPRKLFSGALSEYDVDIEDMSHDVIQKKTKDSKKARQGAKAYSYLSLVNGELEKHRTWKECEARVKGRPNVRFKKSLSPDDELDIIQSWGFKRADGKH